MVDTTWTNGGGDGKASTAANWSNGIDVGYNVIFDGTSTANCTFDYDGQLGTFTIAAGYSGTITQSSDMYIGGYSQAGGKFTGITTKWIILSGNFVFSSGTLSPGVINLKMLSGSFNSGTTDAGTRYLKTIQVSGDSTIIQASTVKLIIDAGKTLTISKRLSVISLDGYQFDNDGTIINQNTVFIRFYGGSHAFDFGLITGGTVTIENHVSAPSEILTFNSDVVSLASYNFYSSHATNSITVELNGHSLTASSISVGTRGILQCGEGTITTTSLDSSAGTITPETAQWIFDGAGTVKTNGTDKFHDLVIREDAFITLRSNIIVENEIMNAGEIALGGYAITHETPSEYYTVPMIYPIVRSVKRSPFFKGRFTKNFERGGM